MTQHLDRPGGPLAHDVAGDGPLVVLAPGMGDLRGVFRDVVGPLRAAGHRVATVDLPGHGDSGTGFTAHGVPAIAEHLAALVEHLGAPAALVGHSVSAGAAALVAAERPELVSSLVLLDPHLPPDDGGRAPLAARLMTQAIRRPLGAPLWVSYYRSLYRGRRPDWLPEHVGAIRAAMRGAHLVAFGRLARALVTAPTPLPLDRVAAPTLVAHGALDPEFADPAAELERALAALPPGAEGLLVPDAGHYPHAQRPDVVVPALLAHLAPSRA